MFKNIHNKSAICLNILEKIQQNSHFVSCLPSSKFMHSVVILDEKKILFIQSVMHKCMEKYTATLQLTLVTDKIDEIQKNWVS